jgi:hypothetical protein
MRPLRKPSRYTQECVDPLIQECLKKDDGSETRALVLYAAYLEWHREAAIRLNLPKRPLSPTGLGRGLGAWTVKRKTRDFNVWECSLKASGTGYA